jgi:geranylgeranyl diphosphate synthase type I
MVSLNLDSHVSLSRRIEETSHQVLNVHQYSNKPNRLMEACEYALSASGKMMRGGMLLQACRAVGGNPEDILHAAAGTEYGHLASLIHDDLMDQDETRRGQATIWRQYNPDFAILVGDLFIFETFHCLSLCRHRGVPAERIARALEVISRSCIDLCLGQAMETPFIKNCAARSVEYIEMIRHKTGSLFRAAVESGAILGGGTDEQVLALRDYGEYLGIAFQIVDDLLCYTGQDLVIRKPTLSDIRNHRVTLPIQYALENANEDDLQTLHTIFEGGVFDEDLLVARDSVIAILQRTGALARAEQEALRYQHEALARLTLLSHNEGRAYLEMAAHMVIKREQ